MYSLSDHDEHTDEKIDEGDDKVREGNVIEGGEDLQLTVWIVAVEESRILHPALQHHTAHQHDEQNKNCSIADRSYTFLVGARIDCEM